MSQSKKLQLLNTSETSKTPSSTVTSELSARLVFLMNETNITEAELARQTGISTSTLNHILIGRVTNPRSETLIPLAKYFNVSIDTILGLQPLAKNRITGSFNPSNRHAWINVPIIDWTDVLGWLFKHDDYHLFSHPKWLTTEKNISEHSFAILSKAFMQPRFRLGSTLIIDPKKDYYDNAYVVVALDNVNVTIRKVIFDGEAEYLQGFDNNIPTLPFGKNKHRYLGTIIEARMPLPDN